MLPRRSIALALCGLLVTAATGCSGDDSGNDTDGAAPSPTPRVSRPPTLTKVTVPPGTAKGFVGARTDVTVQSCAMTGGTWAVDGTVANPTATAVDYRIYTSFLTKDNDTRGLIETDVRGVEPKSKKTWRGQLALSDTGLTCVLRVERTPRQP